MHEQKIHNYRYVYFKKWNNLLLVFDWQEIITQPEKTKLFNIFNLIWLPLKEKHIFIWSPNKFTEWSRLHKKTNNHHTLS